MKQTMQSVFGVLACAMWLGASAFAVQPPSRIAGQVNGADRIELANSVTHRPAAATSLGALPGNTQLTRMTLVLAPSATQQAALDALLANQQNPASASYHKWLTPVQFGELFGVSDADLAKIQNWLTSAGFTIDSVAPSRNTVFFSGTSANVEGAFGTTMQRYRKNGQEFFENSSNLKIPAALNGIVSGVTNLSSYRLKSNLIRRAIPGGTTNRAKPDYTDTSQDHELTPWDFRQIYGLNTLVNSGFTGNVKIVVIGQSAVNTTQIGYFQTLTGQPVKAPTLILVPNTGTSALVAGDEGESEIDIEYAGGTASGASIQFVYTGNGNSNGVFDSVIYAVQQNLAPIITMSYGGCETEEATFALGTFEPSLKQANAQGQTVLVSSGDSDAATCDIIDSTSGNVTEATEGLTVSYPASSPYVTAVGGTRFSEGAGSYWSGTNNSFGGSATGYIPEIVWNETVDPNKSNADVLGTGGGASSIFGKPSWQTGTGVPMDGARDLPDVAFSAAVYNDPYLYCSAELTNGVAQEACTTAAFSNSAVGGTSLSAPNFAAMLAIIEQANGTTAGLGNINNALYTLAAGASATTVFHDVVSGNNQVPCVIGTTDCTTSPIGYSAGVGYDQTTGLGSINGAALATALAALPSTTAKVPTLTLTALPSAPAINTAVTLTVTAAAGDGSTVPTGTVQFTVDGAAGSTVTLSSGSATYSIAAGFSTVGAHTVVAAYAGDSSYSAATSTLTITVGATTSTSGTFSLVSSPADLAVTTGSSGVETITATPASGFAGIVNFTATASGTGTLNACYTLPNATVPANTAGTASLTIFTSAADCATAGRVRIQTVRKSLAGNSVPAKSGLPARQTAILLSGVLLGCFTLRRRSKWPLLLTLAVCAMAIPGLGCGSGGSTSPVTTPTSPTSPSGTNYTITVTGASSTNANLTAMTTFTLTIQ